MIGTFRKNKLNEELITVRGTKQLVIYSSSHPMHTFIKCNNHKGLPCYKGYMNFKTNPKFIGYYVVDFVNRENRLFGSLRSKKLYLIDKPDNITWDEWLTFNDCANKKNKRK